MHRKFYCSLDTLETVVLEPDENTELRALLSHHSQVIVHVAAGQLEQVEADLDNPESILGALLRRDGNSFVVVPQAQCFDDVEALLLAEAAGALVVLDKDPAECEQLSHRFGLCVVAASQAMPVATLTTDYYRQIERGAEYSRRANGQTLSGWRDLLAEKPALPLNALVIIDNYLLKQPTKGEQSTANLLDALLPSSLDEALAFEVLLVISSREYPVRPEILDRIISSLENSLQRSYPIKIGILTHNGEERFHRRAVVSNYHFMRSDRGFAHFTGARADKSNDLTLNGAYHDLSRPSSHLKWRSMAEDLRNVRSLWVDNKRLKDTGRDAIITTNRMQGHCDNRLLSLVS